MSKFFNFDSLISKFEAYVEAKIKLATLNIKEKIASALMKLIPLLLLAFSGILIVIFLSITLGLLFNHLLHSNWLGFAIVTGMYLLFFLIILWINNTEKFKNYVKAKVLNMMNQPND